MKKYIIDNQWISLDELDNIIASDTQIELGQNAIKAIQNCRTYLNEKTKNQNQLMYGINTGFGILCNKAIGLADLEQLQLNLLLTHACGTGEEASSELVKRMLLLKIMSLSHGYSGVQLATIERLIFFYNNSIWPVVYLQGSLGASGDLAPLAHLCLPLVGEGEVIVDGKKISSQQMNTKYGLNTIKLQSKEGLALVNGTEFMSAYASYCVTMARQLWTNWNIIAALSLEAYDGRIEPFQENVNAIRRQNGQIETAAIFRHLLQGSELIQQPKKHVQDPYSFRCISQVHGASKDAIDYCTTIFEREINSVTDNPIIFVHSDDVVSGGNFHGEPLAITMDFLAIALAEMGSISERRVYKLISGTRGLPPFLTPNPGLNSGFMIPQYTCASIVSQNKQLCTPASIDSIDSSNGQEDHVSMGANAATKLYRIVQNCLTIQGIELLNAAQAFEFRRPLRSSNIIEKLVFDFRKKVPFTENDIYLHALIQESTKFVSRFSIIKQ